MPRINAARQREPVRLEARISKELDDVLGWVTSRYAGRLDAFRGALLRYYLDTLVKEEEMAARKGSYQPPVRPYAGAALEKYARLVSSASEGAVTR